ncbi:nicotinate phosphoribosyltransferase [Streptomyces tremellae]|uniref:Nicotinamide phosphoribosyltransferase n=1 Tax=Streptomyces tremellae TaxID=1124239 RepID=A0ABP7G1E4_9ACTN
MVTKFSDFGNIILNTDSYKHSHHVLYPPGTEYVSSYIESRGGPFPAHLFVGLQAFIKEYLLKPITLEDIDEAEVVTRQHQLPFNRDGWLGVLNDHGGYLPLEIEAVPEGTVLPVRNVLVQVVNTDPKYFWLTSFVETALLRAIWYPTSVGTLSWLSKRIIAQALEKTSDHPEIVRDLLHDYGARGVSSQQSAALGGLAHLINFEQTDTISGSLAAQRYYNAIAPGASGPNSEHSTMTAWGRQNEAEAYANAIRQYRGWPVVVIVSDSYDLDNAVHNIFGKELKELVDNHTGTVFVRPDSGDPVLVAADTVEGLIEHYGHTVNSKGYKVLPDRIRVCHGDGITLESLRLIYEELDRRGLAADNVYFGMGGGLLQHINRDSLSFAMKASAVRIDGEWADIRKTPKTQDSKVSKGGRLALRQVDGRYETVRRDTVPPEENLLVPVYRDGRILRRWDFLDLVERSERTVPEEYYAEVIAPRQDPAAAPAA